MASLKGSGKRARHSNNDNNRNINRRLLAELSLDEGNDSFASSRLIVAAEVVHPYLPEIPLGQTRVSRYECRCEPQSVDKQRAIIRILRQQKDEGRFREYEGEISQEQRKLLQPLPPDLGSARRTVNPLQVFGELSRTSLAKGLRIMRRNRKDDCEPGGQFDAVALYKLEELMREANTNLCRLLEAHLSCPQQQSWDLRGEIGHPVSSPSAGETPFLAASYCAGLSHFVIKSPIDFSGSAYDGAGGKICRSAVWRRRQQFSSPGSSDDSGLGDVKNPSRRTAEETPSCRSDTLERHFKFRASAQIQQLVSDSIQFFDQLIASSPFFSLRNIMKRPAAGTGLAPEDEADSGGHFTSQELKLHACVEAQKLRSAIRFTWLPNCLELAFRGDCSLADTGSKGLDGGDQEIKRKVLNTGRQLVDHSHLPPLYDSSGGHKNNNNKLRDEPVRRRPVSDRYTFTADSAAEYAHLVRGYDLLALLMGRLLREFFLSLALNCWCELLERSSLLETECGVGSCGEPANQLSVQVDLIEILPPAPSDKADDASDGTTLAASKRPEVPMLACNEPNDELKSTMSLIVDELAGVCERLPRLENLLDSTKLAASSGDEDDLSGEQRGSSAGEFADSHDRKHESCRTDEGFIRVLQAGDHLLMETKWRLNNLIDGLQPIEAMLHGSGKGIAADICKARSSLPTPAHSDNGGDEDSDDSRHLAGASVAKELGTADWNEFNIDRIPTSGWLHPSYLFIIEMVNRFRVGAELEVVAGTVGKFAAANASTISGKELASSLAELQLHCQSDERIGEEDERLRKLRSSCQLIRLLDGLKMMLRCRMRRYFDLGFVRLDCGPLRESLCRCVNQERRIITRMKSDELLKLMEKLRLQFDEIELAVDLETAIEDHLAERLQIRQAQPSLGGRLMLAGDGNHDDANITDPTDDADNMLALQEAVAIRRSVVEIDIAQTMSQSKTNEEEDGNDTMEAIRAADDEEEETLLEVLTGGIGPNSRGLLQQQQLLSLVGPKAESVDNTEAGNNVDAKKQHQLFDPSADIQVAPLVECRLLVAKYNYFSCLLTDELAPLQVDVAYVFEGLRFLSEFLVSSSVDQRDLEPSQSSLIAELASCSRNFKTMISASLRRLHLARSRLLELNSLRSQVLSKLVLEFHQLADLISKKSLLTRAASATSSASAGLVGGQPSGSSNSNWLTAKSAPASTASTASNVSGATAAANAMRQLDFIQETSAWAQKLRLRNEFLESQNGFLSKEVRLLREAKLHKPMGEGETDDEPRSLQTSRKHLHLGDLTKLETEWSVPDSASQDYKSRASVIDCWRPLTSLLADFWSLAEEFETVQVKRLNTDTKRVDFSLVQSTFDKLTGRLRNLQCQLEKEEGSSLSGKNPPSGLKTRTKAYQNLAINLTELERKFHQFQRNQLPVLKFLANGHLTATHWNKVAELCGATGAVSAVAPQMCTTVAQLFELNVDQFVDELEKIDRSATVEHELTMFLLAEVTKSPVERERQLRQHNGGASWLTSWTDEELVVAAERFLEIKLKDLAQNLSGQGEQLVDFRTDCERLARQIVEIHSTVKRHLKLGYSIGLDAPISSLKQVTRSRPADEVVLRSFKSLSNALLVQPALFVEFLRLFTEELISHQKELVPKLDQLRQNIGTIAGHLRDMDALVDKVRTLEQTDLKMASADIEAILARLERETMALELKRETLATKEALALDRQREALKIRDDCIRQITERAIPALRAATKALDCLDEKCLQTVRSLRPSPPAAVRLVLEAVCLLRSCINGCELGASGKSSAQQQPQRRRQHIYGRLTPSPVPSGHRMSPERKFDALSGKVVEDYWPIASRIINGTHSTRFVADLRRVDKRSIPSELMRLIRRRYLSSRLFDVRAIGQVSRECALLAKWLIAVDVFDRVINVVKPNYAKYVDSERKLSELIDEVTSRGRQIDSISAELQRLEESFAYKVAKRASLAELFADCQTQLKQVGATRIELGQKQRRLEEKLQQLGRKQRRLANMCLLSASKLAYVDGAQSDYREPMTGLILRAIRGAAVP